MSRAITITAQSIPGGISLSARQWDFGISPYPRQMLYTRVGASQKWSSDGDKLRALAAVLLSLADEMFPEGEQASVGAAVVLRGQAAGSAS